MFPLPPALNLKGIEARVVFEYVNAEIVGVGVWGGIILGTCLSIRPNFGLPRLWRHWLIVALVVINNRLTLFTCNGYDFVSVFRMS